MAMDDEQVAVKLAQHEEQLKVALKGVANFTVFTADQRETNAKVRSFIDRTEERRQH